MTDPLQSTIEAAWEQRDTLDAGDRAVREAVEAAILRLDSGEARVAEKIGGEWRVNQWLKKAVLLSFRLSPMDAIPGGPGGAPWWDKVPSKFLGWGPESFSQAGFRAVPGAIVRRGAYVAPGAVLMPSFVNIGARVGEGTMVDTWATVGSCAQIGKNVHLSGGVGIGGVLEPPNAVPVVVEDDAFIGSRCMVVNGARVRAGAVLGAGTILTPTTHVIDVQSGAELPMGEAPAWSVCVGGTRARAFPGGEFGMPCVLVLKRLTTGDRHDKASLNDVLRDHGVNA